MKTLKTLKSLEDFLLSFKSQQEKVLVDKPKQKDLAKMESLNEEFDSIKSVIQALFDMRIDTLEADYKKKQAKLEEDKKEYKASVLKSHKIEHDRVVELHKIEIEKRHEEFILNVNAALENYEQNTALLHTELFDKFDVQYLVQELSLKIRDTTIKRIVPAITNLKKLLESSKTYHLRNAIMSEAVAIGFRYSDTHNHLICPDHLRGHEIIKKLKLYKVRVEYIIS